MTDAVQVRPDLLHDAALRGERLTDLDPRLEAVHTVELRSSVGDAGFFVHDRRHGQIMSGTDREVVRVVRGGDLDCAGTEFGVDIVVGDDRDLAIEERMLEFGSDEGGIPFVVGMHSDRRVAEHRLHSSRRNDDVRLGVVERPVAEADELALDVGVADLDVADRGLEHRRPVDETLSLVDQPVVVHLLEDGLDCSGQAPVHGEAFTGPVDAVAESAHLLPDVAADLGLLLPDPLDEGIATEIVAGESLGS